MSLLIKDPDSRVDYRVDWGPVHPGTSLIVASSWAVTPVHEGGLVIADDDHEGLTTLATLTGGRDGASYALTNRVTLSNGQIDERSLAVRVEQR